MIRHGMVGTRTYVAWAGMLTRATNPNHVMASRYVKRGIKVCARWRSFTAFLADMGECPEGYELDRRENDKGYEPGNCRWATKEEQANNRSTNVRLTYLGREQTFAEWCREFGVRYDTSRARFVRGLPLGEVFSKKPMKRGPKSAQAEA
jgi:hypothetical protein